MGPNACFCVLAPALHCTALQALAGALQAEIAEYYGLMAWLESRAQPLQGGLAAPLLGTPAGAAGDGLNGWLTLHQLDSWLRKPLARMSWLAEMLWNSQGTRGGTLLRAVWEHTRHGDGERAAFLMGIVKKASCCTAGYHAARACM